MAPSDGSVTVNGNIAALLELGSGFDDDLNLKENAYLRGAMLGYTREFMDKKYPEILAFSELQAFEKRVQAAFQRNEIKDRFFDSKFD